MADKRLPEIETLLINKQGIVTIECTYIEAKDGGIYYEDKKPGGQRMRDNFVAYEDLEGANLGKKTLYRKAPVTVEKFKQLEPTGKVMPGNFLQFFDGNDEVWLRPGSFEAIAEIEKKK